MQTGKAWMQRRLVGSGGSKGPDSRRSSTALLDQTLERHTPFAHAYPQLRGLEVFVSTCIEWSFSQLAAACVTVSAQPDQGQ